MWYKQIGFSPKKKTVVEIAHGQHTQGSENRLAPSLTLFFIHQNLGLGVKSS